MNNRTERKRIGYAVLGTRHRHGTRGRCHASDNADLVAVCDIDEARLHQAEQAYPGVTLYRDFEQLLHDERVDIISVCLSQARCTRISPSGAWRRGKMFWREAAGYNTGARGAD